ncbi:hypothetical protein AVEN_268782-1 [Araneus ventricosus]|uniref:Uncharacterized protein n=1 Tax=Araneus ventricosus TaxID=182803 RepID=A0A4Y2QEW2_ARAVE|nr:hypothetical protein AVEN_268782-1 [Araneus ventricosus]
MWTPQEKFQCVAWFLETKSDAKVQWNFGTQYGREPLSQPIIPAWYRSFMETGSVLHKWGLVTHPFQTLTLYLGIGLSALSPVVSTFFIKCASTGKQKKPYELTCHVLKTVCYCLV